MTSVALPLGLPELSARCTAHRSWLPRVRVAHAPDLELAYGTFR